MQEIDRSLVVYSCRGVKNVTMNMVKRTAISTTAIAMSALGRADTVNAARSLGELTA